MRSRSAAILQRQIGAAGGADKKVGAAVLVEEDDMGIEFFELRQHEIEQHCLARARRAADEGVAEIAIVQIEVKWRAGRGLEQSDGGTPFVAVVLSDRIGMER